MSSDMRGSGTGATSTAFSTKLLPWLAPGGSSVMKPRCSAKLPAAQLAGTSSPVSEDDGAAVLLPKVSWKKRGRSGVAASTTATRNSRVSRYRPSTNSSLITSISLFGACAVYWV